MVFLKVDDAITLHDVKQIQKEPAQAKIKTIRKLSKLMAAKKKNASEVAIYTKLKRAESNGVVNIDEELISSVLSVLEVTREQLVQEK